MANETVSITQSVNTVSITDLNAGVDSFGQLSDTLVSSISDKELLQYDASSTKWLNRTLVEAGVAGLAGADFTGPLNIGVDDAGHDVKFFGDTASHYLLWDASDDSLKLSDSAKLKLGNSDDLQIYHDSNNSYITDSGTGNLLIQGASIEIQTVAGNKYFTGGSNVAKLYHTNNEKLATTATGINVTGKLIVSGDLDVSGTTTTFSSSSVSVSDPVFTLGGVSAPSSNDNKDRGIQFHYYDSSAKKGFFGYDNSESAFTFLTDTSGDTEVFSGTLGNLKVNTVYHADGTASYPSVRFNADSDTGIFRPTANNIAITAGGSEVIRFDGNLKTTTKGSVRVNGSTTEGIVIASSSSASQGLKLFNNSSTDDASIFNHYNGNLIFGTSNTERLRIHGGGNITIGGTAGQAMLQLEGGDVRVDNTRSFLTETAGGGVIAAVSMNSSDNLTFGDGNFVIDVTGTSERMRIDSAGNVGIGTTSPSHKLEVAGDIFINGGAAGGRSLQLQRTGATNPWKIVQGHTATNDLEILENQDTRFILKSGGNVGIGTTTPETKLDIKTASSAWNVGSGFDGSVVRISGEADGANQGGLGLSYTNSGGAIIGSIQHGNDYKAITMSGRTFKFEYGSSSPRFFIDSAGKVGIATTSPTKSLDVRAEARVWNGSNGIELSYSTGNTSGIVASANTSGNLEFRTNIGATAKMFIANAGNVGIGTNSPASFLHVSKDNSNSGNQFCVADLEGTNAAVRTYTHGGDAQGLILNHYYAVGGSSNEYMRYADLVANVGDGAGTTMRFITKNAANTYSTVSIDNSGNLDLGDSQKLRLGASDDLQIYHDGTNSYIDNSSTFLILESGAVILRNNAGNEDYAKFIGDGACELYFNGSKKFETTTDGILLSGNGYVDMPDNGRIRMGASYDFAIYHSSSDNKSVIEETGSGNLSIRGTNIELNNAANNKTYLLATDGGSVQLRHNDSTKFETSATGATMGGNLVMGANHLMFANGGRVRLGDSNDLDLYHDGSHSWIEDTGQGDLYIKGSDDVYIMAGSDIAINCNDNAEVSLWYNNAKKFETTATGVTVTGRLTASEVAVSNIVTNKVVKFNGTLLDDSIITDDGSTVTVGGDLTVSGGLTVNGTTTTIDTANLAVEDKNIIIGNVSSPSDTTADGGGITLKGASDYTINWTNSTDSWTFNQGIEIDVGSANAKGIKIGNDSYDASIIPTSLGGVAISSSDPFLFYLNGAIRATFTTDGKLHIPDGGDLALGTGQDLKIGHDGTNGTVSITDGDLRFIQYQDNKMIRFYNDNGTGGTTEYLRIDGSAERVAFERTAHFNDSIQAAFGAGHDLKIYHDGDNSHIKNTNNHLYITNDADDKDIIFRCDDGSGGVTEYFRLDGGATASGFTQTIFPDNSLLLLGDDGDLLMYHNGSQSEIRNSTGDLLIVNRAADKDIIFQSDDGSGGEETYFYLDGSSSSGAPFTVFPDESYLAFGSSLDFTIRHNGTDTYISNDTGDLYIRSDANDKDIIFQSDDGSGGIETYFYLDGDGRQTVFNRPTQHTDGDYAYFGTGFDLKIWHDGTNSNIQNLTGALIISNNADDDDIIFQCDNGEGGVATYFRLDGSFGGAGYPTTLFPNDSSLRFGNSGNLQIINNGTDSYIQENNGDLYIRQSTDDKDIIFQSDDTSGGVATYMIIDGSQSAIRMKRKVKWDDNINATFGDGEDLKIYHEGVGNSSRIENETGPLYITNKANDADIYFQCDDGSGGVETYFFLDGSASSGSPFTVFPDNSKLTFGNGNDLILEHNGADSYISNYTGDLYVRNLADDKDIIFQSDDGSGGNETYFFLDGSLSGGNPYTTFPDNSNLTFGTGSDLTIVHDGNNSYIWSNGTGDLYIQQYNDDKDIVFQCDDGSGGLAEYFRLDGSGAPHPRTVFPDNSTLQFGGVGEGLQIFNDSADTYIQENTRHLYIKANAADAGIKFFADNGSGTATEYFRLDGSNVRSKFTKPVLMNTGQQIYQHSTATYLTHDGSNYYFVNGTGNTTIQNDTADGDIKFKADSGNGSSTTEYFRVDGGEERTVFTKHTIHPDGAQAYFGSGADLRMYHNGTDSHIDNYTGNLNIVNNTNDGDINFYCDDGSGSVEVYFYLDGSLSGGNPYTVFPDNSRLGIGTSADLYFNHDGTDSHINNTEGNLYITNFANDKDIIFKSDDGSGGTTEYFYLDGSAGNILFGKELRLLDGVQIQLGTGNDMQISHNGAIGTIQNTTGDLQLKTLADDSDMIFYSDDGSGSVAMYLSLDGGREIVRHHRGVEYNTVLSNNSDYTVGSANHVILMHGMNAGRTVTIPAAQCNSGRVLIVKDRDGTAATHNITIATGGSETIDGGATHTMSTNRGSVTLISDGSNWFII